MGQFEVRARLKIRQGQLEGFDRVGVEVTWFRLLQALTPASAD